MYNVFDEISHAHPAFNFVRDLSWLGNVSAGCIGDSQTLTQVIVNLQKSAAMGLVVMDEEEPSKALLIHRMSKDLVYKLQGPYYPLPPYYGFQAKSYPESMMQQYHWSLHAKKQMFLPI